MEALHAILPPGTAPALLLLGSGVPWLAGAARFAARLCATVPPLVVALVVDRKDLDTWLQGGESQASAMAREGLLELDPSPPEALAQHLAALGCAPQATLAGSLARLAADGASDELLALFATAAQSGETDAPAASRARSAAEQFLFARLESLPWSRGLFELNAHPGIRFASRPMEVDLLSQRLRLAVEIDGYYHFREPDAYRSDRRKDLALQRQGYLVLRFLADDVVGRLEEILTTLSEVVSLRTGPQGGLPEGKTEDGGA
jgi:hypothetical protein